MTVCSPRTSGPPKPMKPTQPVACGREVAGAELELVLEEAEPGDQGPVEGVFALLGMQSSASSVPVAQPVPA